MNFTDGIALSLRSRSFRTHRKFWMSTLFLLGFNPAAAVAQSGGELGVEPVWQIMAPVGILHFSQPFNAAGGDPRSLMVRNGNFNKAISNDTLGAGPIKGLEVSSVVGLPVSSASNERQLEGCAVKVSDQIGPAIGPAQPVVAICGMKGLVLGYADSFEIATSKQIPAVLVNLLRGSERRILLVSLKEGGLPFLEDLTGQISVNVGRGPMSSLEGIEVDISGFASDGTIILRSQEEGVYVRPIVLDVGRRIAEVREIQQRNIAIK